MCSHHARSRYRHGILALLALVLALSGCGLPFSQGTNGGQPTATQAPGQPTPTITVTSQQDFTCPAAVNGSQKVFVDSETSLRFGYPVAWTEADCQRLQISDGSEILLIGNLFHVRVVARQGRTIQQWVDQQSTKNETVSLTPLTAR
jgi:hypothetical protein